MKNTPAPVVQQQDYSIDQNAYYNYYYQNSMQTNRVTGNVYLTRPARRQVKPVGLDFFFFLIDFTLG